MENDLIRRSDLLAKKCIIWGRLDTGSPCPSKVTAIPVDVIERAPAVDAVEVVRCKDCKYFDTADFDGDPLYGCAIESALMDITPDSFCSYGELKGGSENGD